jgi:hypothetical protein
VHQRLTVGSVSLGHLPGATGDRRLGKRVRLEQGPKRLSRQLTSGLERWLRLIKSGWRLSIRADSEGALCARLVSSFPLSRWEDWQSVHLCCFGGAVTRLLEHSPIRFRSFASRRIRGWTSQMPG